MLDTSRIDAGTFSYRFGDVDLAELVHETVAAAPSSGTDEVGAASEVPARFPPVRGDRERLRQVLDEPDRQRGQVLAGGRRRSRCAPAAENGARPGSPSRDHGPGIAREDQRLIFEKFGRVHDAANTRPGTGLGLFIARSIAEAHGGTLDGLSRRPATGATFTLELPRQA